MKGKIETSICISEKRRERVIAAAAALSVSIFDILAALMRKTRICYDDNSASLWQAVKYQQYLQGGYRIWHVSLDPVCYEFGVSERLVFKVSVSRIYAVAIDLYLDQIVANGLDCPVNENDIGTNYKNARYNVVFFENINHEFWTICWDRRIKKQE